MNVTVKGVAYCLGYAHELGFHHGTTPALERRTNPGAEFLAGIARNAQSWEAAASYAPNLTYIGARTTGELAAHPKPWLEHLAPKPERFGRYGEIMPEDELLGLVDICDVFDLVWLEEGFAASVQAKLASHSLMTEPILGRLEKGHPASEIAEQVERKHALPLYFGGAVAGCCRSGHEVDENLSSHVLLENLVSKATSVLSLLHLLKMRGMAPADVDFIVECSEEAAGDMNQRGGGNMAKAVGEIAGCVNASGFDVRAFCAGPVAALITAAGMVASGIRANVVVLAGGAVPKLYMNAREHVKRGQAPLENCLGSFAALLAPAEDGDPVLRLDALGKHGIGAGATPQAVVTALVWDPLQKAGLSFEDIDIYAPELHIPDITVPAGAGNVPEANYKMIAALAVMKGKLERTAIDAFMAKHGLPGFAHTQGHIPSGVPYLGHAVDAIREGAIRRAMIIGKGSLFLARLTNLADGASFIVEAPSGAEAAPAAGVTKDEVKAYLLEALSELADSLQKP